MKLKIGIFFGGPSREREISFAGGRTVYDNLNRRLFEPVPIFVDSAQNWVLLDWQYLYKGTIRDFFPPVDALPPSPNDFQIYAESLALASPEQQQALLAQVGQPIAKEDIGQFIDLAFLALHGEYGEDGQLQHELTRLGVPYTGSGVEACRIGIDKALQKELMAEKGFACPKVEVVTRQVWEGADIHALYAKAGADIGFPLVIRPANQGSSIGVSIIDKEAGLSGFETAVNRAFFRELLSLEDWQQKNPSQRVAYVRQISDIRDGLGFPLHVQLGSETTTIHHPEALLTHLNEATVKAAYLTQYFTIAGYQSEERVILEAFIRGKEFSCIVLRDEAGVALALPPTEIVKGGEVFDYRSKYMPGLSRKETPIKLPAEAIHAIRRECERLFDELGFHVYARIDGFYADDGEIYLNDPNTTSGMLPSSFFFHQAAEIGLNPSQFLTLIIRQSLWERLREQPQQHPWTNMLQQLDARIQQINKAEEDTRTIGVILGGYSFERHISVESGRNVFEKLSGHERYEPVPIFLTGSSEQHQLYQLPINLLLKDNADDIRDKIGSWQTHPVLEDIRHAAVALTAKYASENVVFAPEALDYDQLAQRVDGVFIALHGRPGEDGQVQLELDARKLPYNGSGVKSSSTTIDKYRTLQILGREGLTVANQLVSTQAEYEADPDGLLRRVEAQFGYPLIAKPVDDGCSAAVKVIHNAVQLQAYLKLLFGLEGNAEASLRQTLGLKAKETFSRKTEVLFEDLITQDEGIHFLEITGGMLTHYDAAGQLRYEVFEPSETLAGGEVLSLEEKFLAGEGQNLTPARLSAGGYDHQHILQQVQHTLERVARILGVEGYCRIDAFVRVLADGTAETQVIEVNSLPGMTPATAIFHQAAIAGYKPAAFIHRILEFGFQRRDRLYSKVAATAAPVASPEATALASATAATIETTAEPGEHLSPPTAPPTAAPSTASGWLASLASLFRTSYFWKNIGMMFGLLVVSFLLLQTGLRMYTKHGDSVQVENYEGLILEEATQKARNQGFEVSVNTAPYTRDIPKGQVIDQEPNPLSRIKKNRTIYLTVIGEPRSVQVPPFKDAADDYEQYCPRLEVLEITCAVKEKVFDAKLAPNTILHFWYRGKKYLPGDVNRGVEIMQGSTLEFVITTDKDKYVGLPSLRCKRYGEASFLLRTMDLSVGKVSGVSGARDDDYIVAQAPAFRPGERILRESKVDLVLSRSRPAGCPADIDLDLDTNDPKPDNPLDEGNDF
jgi:UDP-N-acetylmuramate--alanine ligase